jgi:pectin methylesterase-like acyl-CoA thioesterase
VCVLLQRQREDCTKRRSVTMTRAEGSQRIFALVALVVLVSSMRSQGNDLISQKTPDSIGPVASNPNVEAARVYADRISRKASSAAYITPGDSSIDITGNLGVSGTISGNGAGLTGVEKPKGGTITVAKSGGDFSTIQSAINAASTGDTILIAPGLYEENVAITSKAGLSLIGMCQQPSPSYGVRIKKDVSGDAVVKITDSPYVTFANLYIENTHSPQNSGQEATIELKDSASNSSYFRGENLWLVGGQDCFYIEGYNTDNTELHHCYIDGGVQEPVACDSGATFTDCHFHNHTSGQNTFWVGMLYDYTGEDVLVQNCQFTGVKSNTISCFAPTSRHNVLRLEVIS